MRLKSVAVLSFEWTDDSLPKIVRESRARDKRISDVLDANPAVLALAHDDLTPLSSPNRKGRKADFTSENILRTAVVMAVEGLPLRETVVLIGNSPFLQDFVRLEKRGTMDFTFLDKCLCTVRPETWKAINEVLGRRAVERGQVDPSVVRADTTVVETNIHYPTDYAVMEEREPDSALAEPVVERHEALYGVMPGVLAADKGFSPRAEKRAELEAMVDTLAIPRRMADFADAVLARWQWFRAGIEGTISALKRAFRLFRCLFRGFRNFASGVGLSIFGHNLIVLADQAPG